MSGVNISNFLPAIIVLPAFFAVLILLAPSRIKGVKEGITLTGAFVNLAANIYLYGANAVFEKPLCGYGINFSLKLYQFNGFILISAAAFSFLAVLFSAAFLKGKPYTKQFYSSVLFTLALANGAVLANNLAVLLFFWEGILVTMFAMIMTGSDKAYRTSVKAIIIVGLSDFCMMIGIGMYAYLTKSLSMEPAHLPLSSWGIFAFVFMMIGAVSKAGSMPFHTWIPDAAKDAPLPFMALIPGSLEKLLGIYLLTRICVDLFKFTPGSSMSYLLMILGSVTIIFAVMMALIQKDYKRLLSYHAVSQVGYMMLGIGTALPIGIVGGIFHMINHSIYKSCLFYSAGSVERQAGTTDLAKIGGLGKRMPVTFGCFIIAAASISGFPMTNGFFSKEMIFDGALESGKAGIIFYLIAIFGAFFTAVSFLKLGHTAFLGKQTGNIKEVKEAPWQMLLPMVALSAGCLAFGFGKSWIVKNLLQPVLGNAVKAGETVGSQTKWILVAISSAVLALALIDHIYGAKKTGSSLKAADHIHYAPVLHKIYDMAEKKYFDPYHLAGYVIRGYASVSLHVNNSISWFYDTFLVRFVQRISLGLRKAHSDSPAAYLLWALSGIAIIAAVVLGSL